MHIFICGGSGYLGGLIANNLCKKYDVTVGTRNSSKIKNYHKGITVKKVNYNSYNSLKKSVKNIDLILHMVGMNKIKSEKNPKQSLKVKKKVTENLLKLANKNNSKIIYFSSIQIYKNFSFKKNINENSKTSNIHPYAKAHLAAEKILKESKKKNIIILRLSSVFGANILNTSKELIFTLANNFCYQAVKKGKILIKNPNVIRNFLPSSILTRFVNDLISKHKNQFLIQNLGYKTLNLFELSDLIAKRYNHKFKKVCSIKTDMIFNKSFKKLKFESNYKNYKFNQKLFISELDNLLEFFNKNNV